MALPAEPTDTPTGAAAPGPHPPQSDAAHAPVPVDIAEESIAGEEDPGASLDDALGSPAPSPIPGKAASSRY